jgi:phosphomannomutase/phosphoglucomutase
VAVVTASHNPGRYNGIKFMVGGWPAVPELVRELEKGVDAAEGRRGGGSLEQTDVTHVYEPTVIEQAGHLCAGGKAPLRIVVDTMAGALTQVAPRVLGRAGHHVTSLCPQIDPDFAVREPSPSVDANLQPLIPRVKQEGADVGIAFDGDGDRVIFVDHQGHIVRPEQIGAILAAFCFDRPTVVYDLKCASVLKRAVESVGGTTLIRPSGYGFIKTTVIERQADLGVEASGHHFFRALAGGDDGLFAALVMLNLVSRLQSSLADLVEPVGWPAITPDLRIPFAGDAGTVLERIAENCGGRVTRLDGVRSEYEDGWALARKSITEPAITFRFEGRDRSQLARIAARFLAGAADLRTQVLEKIID